MYNIFDQNDRNQNGLLDMAEYNSFMKSYQAQRNKRFGTEIVHEDTFITEWFKAQNQLTPEEQGISKDDLYRSDKIQMAVIARMVQSQ